MSARCISPLSFTLLACLACSAVAQPTPAAHEKMMDKQKGMTTDEPQLALEGYCPLCITEMKQWVKGKEAIQTIYDGHVYYFPEAKAKVMFDANPAQFVPALGGDCVVCLTNMGERVPGDVKFSARHERRVYLFPAEAPKQEFLKNPARYADIDLALDGKCAVCLAMGHEVAGKEEFAAYHQGMRYLFPSAKERDAFLASPEKFAVQQAGATREGRPTSLGYVSVAGASGCAACSYGVRPLGDEDSLGLAIKAADGQVYVVEGAERDYPKLFENRFDGLRLQLEGDAIRQQGKFTWVQPVQVRALN